MINIKKTLIFIIFIFLSNCGYNPIFSSNNSKFAIIEIKFFGEKNIASKINNNLKIYRNTKDKNIFYSLEIYSDIKKNIITKDTKGNPQIFEMNISINLNILENDEIKNKKTFIESFTYNNSSNKFDLAQYEKNIQDNLINEIVSKIVIHLYSLR